MPPWPSWLGHPWSRCASYGPGATGGWRPGARAGQDPQAPGHAPGRLAARARLARPVPYGRGHRPRVPLCRPALPVVVRGRPGDHRRPVVGAKVLRPMTTRRRCAIYTRKSTEEGLEQDFNSLHAQREACEAFIRSQRHEGWQVLPEAYDDGGYSGGTMDRPALSRLLEAAQSGTV